MAALGAAANRRSRGTASIVRVPVKATTQIWKGGIVAIDTAGLAVPGADTAAFQVIGIAAESRLGGATDGAVFVEVEYQREYLFAATSITQVMLGDLMVIVTDNDVDDAAGATNDIAVGRLTEFVSTTSGWVFVPGLSTL